MRDSLEGVRIEPKQINQLLKITSPYYDSDRNPFNHVGYVRPQGIYSHNQNRMAAYIMSAINIHDKKKFDQTYFPVIVKQVERYGARLLAASDMPHIVEGNWLRGRTVLWEFPDVEATKTWYHSEEYAPLLKLRQEISTASIILIPEGVTVSA